MTFPRLAWFGPVVLALSIVLAGCVGAGASEPTPTVTPAPTATPDPRAGESVEIGEFTGVLWGTGDYGVVLVGSSGGAAESWRDTALEIAAEDVQVLALNDYSYSYVVDAIDFLRDERGVANVALIGVGTGAPPVIGAGIIAPEKVDQLILVSGFGEYQKMGDFPKFFIAAEGETGMARRAQTMAKDAPGDDNAYLIIPGAVGDEAMFSSDSHDELIAAIIERLTQFRTS